MKKYEIKHSVSFYVKFFFILFVLKFDLNKEKIRKYLGFGSAFNLVLTNGVARSRMQMFNKRLI